LRTEPELDSALAEIDYRLRHILVFALVLKDGVAVGEVEDVGHSLRIEEVFRSDSGGHRDDPTSVGGGSVRSLR
jgi:hypothetical protein